MAEITDQFFLILINESNKSFSISCTLIPDINWERERERREREREEREIHVHADA